jgi:MFS family permease
VSPQSAFGHPLPVGEGEPRLGLSANWRQFALLVVVNAFVGGMVGLERAVLPLVGEQELGVASRAAILSFVASFGIVKAFANLFAGKLSDRFGRKGVLVAGWLAGLPVPFLVMFAPSWGWIVAANLLLGVNQGLCWSMTVIMKIDLVGPSRRGLALGLNEASGYGAVSLAALASGYLAATYGLRPQPFYLGVALAVLGLLLSLCFVRESHGHARQEARLGGGPRDPLSFASVVALTSWRDRALSAASQAGMVNNLNDGMAWGLLPLYFAAAGLPLGRIAFLSALYPGVWAIAQLVTGAWSDRVGRKPMIVAGMWMQAAGIALLVVVADVAAWTAAMAMLGLGTALVYPTLIAAVSDVAHASWRASAVGVYRLWRDGGYAVGALLAGLVADVLGVPTAIVAIAALTFLSGVVVLVRMYETLPAAAAPHGAPPSSPANAAMPPRGRAAAHPGH